MMVSCELGVCPLFRARTTLCDILLGRVIRGWAAQRLTEGLEFERMGLPREIVTTALDGAAHWEWIATITERGQVLWGRRRNRDGATAEERTAYLDDGV